MTNKQIYEYAQKLSIFSNCNLKLPVRISFYLQKNIQLIQQAAEEIEKARLGIGVSLGTPNEAGNGYDIPPEKIGEANQQLNELFELEQDINIHMFKIDDFADLELTYQEMSAIMFMIEE
jgi:hypothetical protein